MSKLDQSLDDIIRGQGSGGDAGRKSDARVYVGNLSYEVRWQDLKDQMRKVGNVTFVNVLTFPDGKSKGCAVVEYATRAEALRAIKELTDTELGGRKIFVREDREGADFAAPGAAPIGRGRGRGAPRGRGAGGLARGRGRGEPPFRPSSAVAQSIRSQSDPECQIYIGNLSYGITWQDLKDLCSQYGDVRRADVEETPDGKSKGFGLVVFADAKSARAAIEALHDSECDGRKLVVRHDRGSKVKAGGGGAAAGAGAGGPAGGGYEIKVYVGNLPWSTSWQDLKDLCKEFGDVIHAEIAMNSSGRSHGFGLVTFRDNKEAEACIHGLDGADYQGRALSCRLDQYS